ncbi:nose resistant to fluoxetine protein 6-like [Nesidiocoris tenuis]|uniref:Nose resistant to fluoxetine protein 6-like n=2 Tax=Nesidiocoris tenuis TaxID=355587 RepID=A0ABN7AS99_9HEMI|nr:nose resistant to fluoxetine protein 6-like [Nesidiocoris tenuis]
MFFFGNDFWLGSKVLCSEITASGPMAAAFHLVRFTVKLDPAFTPYDRDMSLGVCLPAACSAADIQSLLETTTARTDSKHRMSLLRVRAIPGPYSLASDPKFHIMGSVVILVALMMIIGTIYEAVLERRQKLCRLRRSNNNESGVKPADKISFDKDDLTESETDLVNSVDPCRGLGLVSEVVLSFSILSNGRKILDCGPAGKDSLTCVHGLRFLSLAWVIMVHTYLQIFAIAENKKMRTLTEENFMFQTVANATFSVDSFFFISGLLVAYLYFKSQNKGEQSLRTPRTPKPLAVEAKSMTMKFLTLLGYRFIRLTPAYLFVLGCAELAMKWLKNNSVFEPISLDNVNCAKYWWRNALYINSLYPRSEMCMLWSWYLANDTQFYAIGVLLLLISSRFFRVAVSSLFMLLISSTITTALISYSIKHVVSVQEPFKFFDELYDKPWMRLGPYIAGIMAGWFVHRTKCSVKMSMLVNVSGWAVALSTLMFLVYGVRDANFGVTGTAMYISLGHTAWGAALAWIVIACTSGYGGWINSLLSCKLLQPLSRLAYCAYLVHPVIMVLTSFQMEGSLHINNNLCMILYFGNLVASFLLSFVISIAFEAPVVRLLKVCVTPMMEKQNSS